MSTNTKPFPIPLAQLASLLKAQGSEVLEELFRGQPVLVIRARAPEVDETLYHTPPDGVPVPDTDKWAFAKESDRDVERFETGSADELLSKSGFDADSPVVPICKSDRNPLEGMITLGRASDADIRLASPCVSKLHAFFEQSGDQWRLQDKGSANHTWLNKKKLDPNSSHELDTGDEVRFADVTATFLDLVDLKRFCGIIRL
jgi:hypothetical protein